jgi:Tfp pilus assembly protein PilP
MRILERRNVLQFAKHAVWLGLILLSAACGAACGGDELDKYSCEFDRATDDLIKEMKNARGTKTGTYAAAFSDKKIEFKYAKIHHVGKEAIEFGERYSSIPMTLYLSWSTRGLTDDEETQLREIMTTQQEKYKKALQRLKADIRKRPRDYKTPIVVKDPFSVYRNTSYWWGDDGELHITDDAMMHSQSRYVIMDNVLSYDVDDVIAAIDSAYETKKIADDQAGDP